MDEKDIDRRIINKDRIKWGKIIHRNFFNNELFNKYRKYILEYNLSTKDINYCIVNYDINLIDNYKNIIPSLDWEKIVKSELFTKELFYKFSEEIINYENYNICNNFSLLSRMKWFDIELIIKYCDKDLNWYHIFDNKIITIDIINSNIEFKKRLYF